ncbi:MAG: endonuclease domain-containing protein [Candidatus Giovannonibacteria bacterium]|nr:endonuclease domain-containing protein [Candidatus Giovannonibacteria bacterium]
MTQIFNKKSQTSKRKILRNRMPPSELLLWPRLNNKQLNGFRFRRQYGIDRYVVDFYCPKLRLAIEIDGGYHRSSDMKEYDPARQAAIEAIGIKFLRFSNKEIESDLEGVMKKLFNALPPYEGGRVGLGVKEKI